MGEVALSSSFSTRLNSSLQEVELRRSETDADLRARIEAAVSDVGAAAHATIRRALRPFTAEAASERRQRQAGHEELLVSFLRCEQTAVSVRDEQAEAIKRLSEELAGSQEQRHREERGLWTKVHELTRTLKDRIPQERRELMEAAEQNLDRGIGRRLTEVREELRRDVRSQIESQSSSVRGELQRALSSHVDEEARRALAQLDRQADCRAEEMQRLQERSSRAEAEILADRATASTREAALSCEAATEAVALKVAAAQEAMTKSVAVAAEEQQDALRRLTVDSRQAVNEVEEELRAFMGEQRVFCGFLDAEQKSYH